MIEAEVMERSGEAEDDFEGIVDEAGQPLTHPAAERALLGAMMLDPECIERVAQEFTADNLADHLHRRIFEKLTHLYDIGAEIKPKPLIEALGGDPNAKIFQDMTVGQYIARLLADADPETDPLDVARVLMDIAERSATSTVRDIDLIREPFKSQFGLVMWEDQNQPGPEYDFIVEDLIPEAEPVLIFGESQTGKSFWTAGLALALARGVPFFGHRILEPRWVVYGAWEAGRGWNGRMRAYAKHHGLMIDSLPFGVLTRPIDIYSDEANITKIIAEIKAIAVHKFGARYDRNGVQVAGTKPGAFVIDTYNAATPGASEINSEEVSKIRERIMRICRETGASVWIVSHKNAQGRLRGNEQLYNNVGTAIDISRKFGGTPRDPIERKDDDGRAVRVVKVRKQREGQDGETWEFVLKVVETGSRDKFGKMRTSCVVVSPNVADVNGTAKGDDANADKTIGVKASKAEMLFLQCVIEATASDGVAPPPELGLPRSIGKVVDYDIVKRLISAKMLREEDNSEEGQKRHRERVKKANKRAREFFTYTKVIGGHMPFIWWTGKPVRGVPETQPKRRELFDSDPSYDEFFADDPLRDGEEFR